MTFDEIVSHGTVVSTMDIARSLAVSGEAAGTVVMAEFQTGGRGRQGRSWFAPPGANVCLTAIGAPVAAADAWRVALLAGVAAAEGVSVATGLAAGVRFPNDIYLNGRKLGGILIETAPTADPHTLIPLIGIGININVPAFPPELQDRATSTFAASGHEFPVGAVAGHVLRRLGELWEELADAAFASSLLPRWRGLASNENRRSFRIGEADVLCRVVDVGADGVVTLETADGARHAVHATQVILGDD